MIYLNLIYPRLTCLADQKDDRRHSTSIQKNSQWNLEATLITYFQGWKIQENPFRIIIKGILKRMPRGEKKPNQN